MILILARICDSFVIYVLIGKEKNREFTQFSALHVAVALVNDLNWKNIIYIFVLCVYFHFAVSIHPRTPCSLCVAEISNVFASYGLLSCLHLFSCGPIKGLILLLSCLLKDYFPFNTSTFLTSFILSSLSPFVGSTNTSDF